MAMFQLEISFLFELALLAAGLVLLHLGSQASAALMRAAGFILVVGAVLTAVCTGYLACAITSRGSSTARTHHITV